MKSTLETQLPEPCSEAAAQSQHLLQQLGQQIHSHGPLSFAEFMQQALYAPGLGYYSAGAHKFGAAGDFVTAPIVSPLFSRCLARQCQEVLQALDGGDILEFGAGTGIMAADILLALEEQDALPKHYYILELSPDLQARQRETIEEKCPHLLSRVEWLSALPSSPIRGVMLGNEVLDAMPVEKFSIADGSIFSMNVGLEDERLVWQALPANNQLAARIEPLQAAYQLDHYTSEISTVIPNWVASVSDSLAQGAIFLIDYGFPQHEYYHPSRSTGTLMCHYQHRAHPDPLILVGLQDITAHVDFTLVAESAVAAGLHVAGFTTQAYFLLSLGIIDMLGNAEDMTTNQAVKILTLPSEMGELFKVIGLSKDLDLPLQGFTLNDARRRL